MIAPNRRQSVNDHDPNGHIKPNMIPLKKNTKKTIRAAIQLKNLIAINRAFNIFNRDYSHQNKKHKFVAQNNSIIHDITSIA